MREPKLGYTAHSCRSTFENRLLGSTVKLWLESQSFPRGSAALFIKRSLDLPGFSLRTYEALKEKSPGEFKLDDLKLVFVKPTAVAWIPNLWLGEEYQESVEKFRRLPPFKKVSCGTALGPGCPFAYLSLADLFRALEARCLALMAEGNALKWIRTAESTLSKSIVAVIRDSGSVVAMGAIKCERPSYVLKIRRRSKFTFATSMRELGYFSVCESHRDRRLSGLLVEALLSHSKDLPIFATTWNVKMKSTLRRAGFVNQGVEWQSANKMLSLWIRG